MNEQFDFSSIHHNVFDNMQERIVADTEFQNAIYEKKNKDIMIVSQEKNV